MINNKILVFSCPRMGSTNFCHHLREKNPGSVYLPGYLDPWIQSWAHAKYRESFQLREFNFAEKFDRELWRAKAWQQLFRNDEKLIVKAYPSNIYDSEILKLRDWKIFVMMRDFESGCISYAAMKKLPKSNFYEEDLLPVSEIKVDQLELIDIYYKMYRAHHETVRFLNLNKVPHELIEYSQLNKYSSKNSTIKIRDRVNYIISPEFAKKLNFFNAEITHLR